MTSQQIRDIPESERAALFPSDEKKEENPQKVEQAQPVQQQGQNQLQQQQLLQVMQAMQAMQAAQGNQGQPQQQRFYQIIDIVNEYLRTNFLPAIHALRFNLIPKNYIDYTGFNYLHIAVSQNQIPIVLLLIDTFKLDVNIRSTINQTPLMVACNYGHLEIVKILCDRGAQINPKDNTGFSALTYAAKNDFVPIIAYLLHQEADIGVVDMNGCTLVHWAAYRNNVFLLKMLRSLGQNMSAIDLAGMEPIERAISSNSIEAVQYLVQFTEKKPQKLDMSKVTDPDLVEILRKKFEPTKTEIKKAKFINGFLKKSRWATFAVYLILWLMAISLQAGVVMKNRHGFSLMRNIIWIMISLYSLFYAFWYFTKSHKFTKKYKPVAQKDDSMELSTIQSDRRFNSAALDKLLRGKDEATIIQEVSESATPSFLHELASQFDSRNYQEIRRWNLRDYCPSCLIKKPERSEHHEKSALCVQHFHHYSYTLGKAINKENHFLYFVLLLQQQILLTMLIFGVWSERTNRDSESEYHNSKMWIFESVWDLYNQYSVWQSIYYVIMGVLLCYNTFFFFLEVYLMAKNLTFNEFFNRNSKNYLFQIKRDIRGQFVRYFKNPYDMGVLQNIKQYIMRAWHSNNF